MRGLEFAEHALNVAPLLYLERHYAKLNADRGDERQLDFEATDAELDKDEPPVAGEP